VRTKARYEYSYVQSAAVQIGDDVLEVTEFGGYMVNGVSNAGLPLTMADKYTITKVVKNDHDISFKIHEGDIDIVVLKAFKDLVSVKFGAGFRPDVDKVQGLLGDKTGAHYSRDHTHIIEDNDEFGTEWQVIPGTDPDLFQAKAPDAVRYPNKCQIPEAVKDTRRHLGESISVEDATKACEKAGFHLKGAVEACVYDVIATGDLSSAQAGAF